MVNAAFSGNTRESYRFESCPDYKKLKTIKNMELILYVIMGIMIGTLIGIVSVKLFMSKPSVDYKELIKQSEQRLEIVKKHGEELDKMLEEM